MKFKNKKLQVALLMMWSLPILLSLVVIANTSESASQANFKHLMISVPKNCNVQNNQLICGTNIFSKKEVNVIQDFKQNVLKNLSDPKLGQCRLFASHQSVISGLIPVKYYQADNDYKMTVFCAGETEVYTNLFTYASRVMNEEFIKNKGCEKIKSQNPVVMKVDDTFKIAEKGTSYICEKSEEMTDEIYSPKNMLKTLFKQECVKDLNVDGDKNITKNDYEMKCDNLFNVFSQNQLKKEKTGFLNEHNVFKEMDFLKH